MKQAVLLDEVKVVWCSHCMEAEVSKLRGIGRRAVEIQPHSPRSSHLYDVLSFKTAFSASGTDIWFPSSKKDKVLLSESVFLSHVLVSPFEQNGVLVLPLQDVIHIFKRCSFLVMREQVDFFYSAWLKVAKSKKTDLLQSVPKAKELIFSGVTTNVDCHLTTV